MPRRWELSAGESNEGIALQRRRFGTAAYERPQRRTHWPISSTNAPKEAPAPQSITRLFSANIVWCDENGSATGRRRTTPVGSPHRAKHREGEHDGGRSRSDEVMMKASSGPSPAPWRFRGIASGTVVIEHPGKAAPARAAPGQLRQPGEGSRRPMAAFDEPLHAAGKHQSQRTQARHR